MTAVLEIEEPAAADATPEVRLASWGARAGALAVDVIPGLVVAVTMALLGWATPQGSWLWWVFSVIAALAVVAVAANRLVLPTVTGFSLGRALFGIAVVGRDGRPPAVWRLLARDLAHLLDTAALFVGWLWPLWDGRNRTFADLVMRTEVHRAERPRRDVRRLTGGVLVAATVVCAAGVGLGYAFEYRHDRAVDAARAQIAEQGPKMIEQLLTYKAETLDQDFANAQSLTTEAYRPQLIDQQQAVKQAGATTNEYWAVSSAVLSATPDRGSMLAALQGQRGAGQDLKFITATVRVDFEKTREGAWRVANLIVLKKPQMEVAPQ